MGIPSFIFKEINLIGILIISQRYPRQLPTFAINNSIRFLCYLSENIYYVEFSIVSVIFKAFQISYQISEARIEILFKTFFYTTLFWKAWHVTRMLRTGNHFSCGMMFHRERLSAFHHRIPCSVICLTE